MGMTPKDKATDLFVKMFERQEEPLSKEAAIINAKYCANVVVDEHLETFRLLGAITFRSEVEYWNQVKEELKLI